MDDAISREAAFGALDGEIAVKGRANAEAVRGYVNLVADRIKRLPSAEPVRMKGIWEGKPIAGYCTVRCSACGTTFRDNSGRWNFCPNCGAQMTTGEKNDCN